ncbi:MAG: hypothetical protein IH861_12990 [Chloroflexi bacterium]|nr:hypothetical protein [Chloroflexota bacterium]
MRLEPADLSRFQRGPIIGEGADMQVFAATDIENGMPVVVKRPHPQLVTRSQHKAVEARIERTLALRDKLGADVSGLCNLTGIAPPARHDAYFGDSLGEPYTVVVEEWARGVPLVGSSLDRIRRNPIALPYSLFALHPVVLGPANERTTIARQALDLVEAFLRVDTLLLDMRPQNVYFDPLRAKITLIDIAGAEAERPESRRHQALDFHDVGLELFMWYTTPQDFPRDGSHLGISDQADSVSNFRRDVESLIQEHSSLSDADRREAALPVLERLRQRSYGAFDDFRRDFEHYLTLIDVHNRLLAERPEPLRVWHEAASRLNEPYWGKFRFDAQRDLAPYLA